MNGARAMNPTQDLPALLVIASTYPRWSGDPEPGFVHQLARRMTASYRVTVLCPHAEGAARSEWMDGVEVIRYRYAPAPWQNLVNDGGIVANLRRDRSKLLLVPPFLLAQFWACWRLLRRRSYDAVHAHWLLPQGLLAAIATRLSGRKPPFLVTSHGGDLFSLKAWPWRLLKRYVLRQAGAAAVVSEGMLDEVGRLGVDSSRVLVEPMGVDLDGLFVPDPAVPRSSADLLFVGRLVEKKGLGHLINAMPAIISARPDARLTVIGFGPEMEERLAQVQALGLNNVVQFLGARVQADLPAFYQRAALFVAPFVEARGGDQDGLGLVLVEALGCGCPVLASDMPATSQLAAHTGGLRLIAPGDPRSLAEKVLEMLDAPPAVKRSDIACFNWQARADAYVALVARLIARDASLRPAAGTG